MIEDRTPRAPSAQQGLLTTRGSGTTTKAAKSTSEDRTPSTVPGSEQEPLDVAPESELGNYHGLLPDLDDPIYSLSPDDPVQARLILRMVESIPAQTPEDRKLYKSMAVPRTALSPDHEDPWDIWHERARDPEKVQMMWKLLYGPDVPDMTTYELRAVIRNVNQRLLFKSIGMPPPCMTDCYDPIRGRYWSQSEKGRWHSYSENQYRKRLFRLGRGSDHGPGNAPSELDSDIEAVVERQAIITEGISGMVSGVHELNDRLYLAKFGYKMVEPDPSNKPDKTLKWLHQMLDEEGMERFLDWIYHGVIALKNEERTQSRILAIAGPSNCGKSYLVREIVRQLLGGRAADVAPWLLGTTEFAAEIGSAELLYVDDALGDGRLLARLRTAARLKELVTAGSKPQPIHAKGKDRYYHPVSWRVAIAINDSPEALAMLPPLDEGFSDKIILLRARESVLNDRGDRAAVYIEAMQEELPGLMAYILERGIQGPVDGRGPLSWQDPVLASKLRETAPEYALAGMIVETIEKRGNGGIARPIIEPTLTDLASYLRDCCGERYTRLCPTDRSALKYLQRLERDKAVSSRKVDGRTRWCLEHLDKWLQLQHTEAEA